MYRRAKIKKWTGLAVPRKRFLSARLLTVAATVAAALVIPGVAHPAIPSNDNFADASVVTNLPFGDSVDVNAATTEPGEPTFCGASKTVWYSITPTSDEVLKVDADGSGFFDTNLSVYRADGPGLAGLSWLNCGSFGNPVVFNAHAGTTYYIQGGSIFGGGGALTIHVTAVPPPPNDGFTDAAPIGSAPFSNAQDITGASTEAGEPVSSCSGTFTKTVWYSFTPATSGTFSASTNAFFGAAVNVYTGSSLSGLSLLTCGGFGGLGTFHADSGTTYYLQSGSFGGLGQLQTNLVATPPPAVGFAFGPGDPSIFDSTQFFSTSFDPGNVGIESQAWSFGDGATANGCCPTHRYTADADYTVGLTVTTIDGRSASDSQVIHVKTHDIAITRLVVPQSARVGQTRQIVVGLLNHMYPETVQVQLSKSVAGGGSVTVGTATQAVPVRGGNRTTDFNFAYTFTSDDAALGRVTFQAVATIVNARDALPADNNAIALPTRVTP